MSVPPPALPLDNPLWRFSCAVYAAPGVQPACLALQDRFGLDVNIALLCAWLGAARGVPLGPEAIAEAEAATAAWRDAAVAPLRAARRAIKASPLMADPAVATLRERIAALELAAEQVQQALLFRWAAARDRDTGATAAANLDALLRLHARGAAAPHMTTLAQAATRQAASG